MIRSSVKVVLSLVVSTAFHLNAAVVFSNITGTGSVNGGVGICGNNFAMDCGLPPGVDYQAESFTPAATYMMSDAQVLVATETFGTSSFDVFVYSDSGGLPGSLIEQIGSGLSATTAFPGSIITANSVSVPITLLSGTTYWLALGPYDSNSAVVWSNGGSPSVPHAFSDSAGASWVSLGDDDLQFQIDGDPVTGVPEPTGLGWVGGVACLLCLLKERGKLRQRDSDAW